MRLSALICVRCGQQMRLPDRPPWLICGCTRRPK